MSRARTLRLTDVLPAPKESEVQAVTIELLGHAGYIVCQTTHQYRKQVCGRCHNTFWSQGGYGATRGVPDLLVTHPLWPEAVWVGVEMKSETGKLSAQQAALLERGRIVVARSDVQALDELQRLEREMTGRVFGRTKEELQIR